jgi:hypothetical protein
MSFIVTVAAPIITGGSARGADAPPHRVDVAEVKRLISAGRTRQFVADTFGVSKSAISKILRSHGIYAPRDSFGVIPNRGSQTSDFWVKHDAEFRVMVEVEGVTATESAARLGTTKNACIGRANRLSYTWRRSPVAAIRRRPKIDFPETGRCVFPHGDLPEMTFCGHRAVEGRSYCEAHAAIAYLPPRPIDMRVAA